MIQVEDYNFKIVSETLSEKEISRVLSELAKDLAQNVEDLMRDITPVRTGRLKESVRSEALSECEYRVVVGSPEAYYAPFVFLGTRPHVIEPKTAKALRFEIDGSVIFAKRVYHPGTKPIPLWEHLTDLMETVLPKVAEEVFERVLGASEKGE